MISRAAAEALVRRYIQSWKEAWQSVEESFRADVDFTRWRAILEAVDAACFAPGQSSGSWGSYGTPPTHDPDVESVVGFTADGPTAARVETASRGIVHE